MKLAKVKKDFKLYGLDLSEIVQVYETARVVIYEDGFKVFNDILKDSVSSYELLAKVDQTLKQAGVDYIPINKELFFTLETIEQVMELPESYREIILKAVIFA